MFLLPATVSKENLSVKKIHEGSSVHIDVHTDNIFFDFFLYEEHCQANFYETATAYPLSSWQVFSPPR